MRDDIAKAGDGQMLPLTPDFAHEVGYARHGLAPDHRAHGFEHGLLEAQPRILRKDDFYAFRCDERSRDSANVDAGAELHQRDLRLLVLRHAESGVERDRIPDYCDLLVGVALPGEEVGRCVRAIDLEVFLADELVDEAKVVQDT